MHSSKLNASLGQQEAQERLLITTSEAAKALGIGRSTLYALMGQGRLSFVLIGRSRRVPLLALHRFVQDEAARQGFSL